MAWEELCHEPLYLSSIQKPDGKLGIRCGLWSPSERKLLREVPATQKEKLSLYLIFPSTEGCQVVSCLSCEVFKHGVLWWAEATRVTFESPF